MKGIKKFIYRALRKVLYSGHFGNISLNQNLLRYLPDTLNTYIDIGAYDGIFFDLISSAKKINTSMLIEAQNELYNKLILKYKLKDSVRIFNAFLSSKIETRTFNINKLGATSSTFEFNNQIIGNQLDISCIAREEKTTTTLDLIIPSSIDKIDLIKIDVQGAELLVLQGAEEALKITDYIYLEVSLKKIYNDIPTFEEIQNWLNLKGFVLIEMTPAYKSKNDELLQVDCLFKHLK